MFHAALLKALRDRERQLVDPPDEPHEEPAERTFPDDMSQYSLGIRRKRMQGIMKHMLTDAGYGDLAKMSSITRHQEERE